MALKTSMQFDTTAQSSQPIIKNNKIVGYQTIKNTQFSDKMMKEYEQAKIIGFAGTYEEYLMYRDFT